MRLAVVAMCVVVAIAAALAMVLATSRGTDCGDLRFDRAEWVAGDRDEYAACVVEVQPFRGLEDEDLVRRLGPPNERRRGELRWWIGADDDFGMKIDALVIPVDGSTSTGPARIARTG
jgi:hypothetical protein